MGEEAIHAWDAEATGSVELNFHRHLLRLLARYEALGGHGYQAALNQSGFDILLNGMAIAFECFASPLNCRYGRFCSAFPDTDSVFGSICSFFQFQPKRGSFEANPPFVPEFMDAMIDHIETLLQDDQAGPLSFTIIVPTWERVIAWKRLKKSSYCQTHFCIGADEHVFCDGNQHQKEESSFHRPSSYGTTVFFLQNKLGAKEWPATAKLQEDLSSAMATSTLSGRLTIKQYERKNRGTAKQSVLGTKRPRKTPSQSGKPALAVASKRGKA